MQKFAKFHFAGSIKIRDYQIEIKFGIAKGIERSDDGDM